MDATTTRSEWPEGIARLHDEALCRDPRRDGADCGVCQSCTDDPPICDACERGFAESVVETLGCVCVCVDCALAWVRTAPEEREETKEAPKMPPAGGKPRHQSHGVSREEMSMEQMKEAARAAKKKHPTLSELAIFALLTGGDKDKSALVGDALNAIAGEEMAVAS